MKISISTYLLVVVTWTLSVEVFAQSFKGPVDSLQQLLGKETLTNAERVDVLNALAAKTHGSNYTRAMEYANEAIALSNQIDYAYGLAKAYQNVALTSWANGRYDDALVYHKKAIDMFTVHGFDGELAEAYNKLGLVHFYIAEYDKAIDFLAKAVERYRAKKDTINLARVLNNLGLVHDSKGEYATSTEYIIESLQLNQGFSQLRDQQNRTYNRSLIHENEFINRRILERKRAEIERMEHQGTNERLANLYVEVAEVYFVIKEFSQALSFYRKAEEMYAELDDPVLVAHCLRDEAECFGEMKEPGRAIELFKRAGEIYLAQQNFIRLGSVVSQLADTYRQTGHADLAIDHYRKVIAMNDTLGQKAALSKMKATLAGVLLQEGHLTEALENATAAYEVAKSIGSLVRVESSARQLYECYKRIGNMNEALSFLEESSRLKQQFDDDLSNRQIAELQIVYETSEKQKEIDQLSQIADLNASVLGLQRQMIVLLSLSLLAFVVLLVFVNGRLRKIRSLNRSLDEHQTQILEQNNVLEKRGREKELLISEIHHRVKNNLQIISSLLRLQQHNIIDESARAAIFEGQNRVQSMSLLHQRLYQQGSYESVDLKSYTNDIFDHLLKVYQIGRSEMDLTMTCDDVTLDVDTAVTFGLIINEVYSNIFKHASSQGRRLVIGVEACVRHGEVAVKVTDNGPGFPEAVKKGQMGFGLSLVRMMVGELSGHVTFESDRGEGAVVTITFPSHDSAAVR